MARWVPVMAHFERGLYADPDQDLGELWWSTVERFQGIGRPPVVRPHDWATKIHLTVAPVYYHNYLLGEVLASQLEATLQNETGAGSPAVHPQAAGRILRERFQAPGAREPWSELVRAVTGKPLGAADFIGGLVGDGRNEVPAVSIDP
jgi:peptidyl-dipeptidase A